MSQNFTFETEIYEQRIGHDTPPKIATETTSGLGAFVTPTSLFSPLQQLRRTLRPLRILLATIMDVFKSRPPVSMSIVASCQGADCLLKVTLVDRLKIDPLLLGFI